VRRSRTTERRFVSDAAVPLIAFLSDYGYGDEFVGVCHAVIARRCPRARVIDITHGVRRHDVIGGSLALCAAIPYMSASVLLAVVDPGVGGARRAVALRCAQGASLVGPDNGLLAAATHALGGVQEAVEISRSAERLQPVSATFHGRDVFAPVAAALADGAALRELGEPLDARTLVALELPRALVLDGRLRAHALTVDAFGNIALDATLEDALAAGLTEGGGCMLVRGDVRHPSRFVRTFSDVADGELLLYLDANERLAVALNGGSAAARLACSPGEELAIERSA
jgi:S-adenosylmethionine hydrolase